MARDSFKDFVLDQLRGLSELRAKAMFGGHGLYASDQFFGILMDGRLYFRTDDRTRPLYEQRGMGPFTYEKARQTIGTRYHEVPPDVLENRNELEAWATQAIAAARAGNAQPRAGGGIRRGGKAAPSKGRTLRKS